MAVEAVGAAAVAGLAAAGFFATAGFFAAVGFAYRQNVVELDPKDLSVDVELKTAAQNIAPRAGSVVKLQFETTSGQALLITALRGDSSPLPFGSDVFDEDGASVGVVG